jgi:hypothetical protein
MADLERKLGYMELVTRGFLVERPAICAGSGSSLLRSDSMSAVGTGKRLVRTGLGAAGTGGRLGGSGRGAGRGGAGLVLWVHCLRALARAAVIIGGTCGGIRRWTFLARVDALKKNVLNGRWTYRRNMGCLGRKGEAKERTKYGLEVRLYQPWLSAPPRGVTWAGAF